MLIPRFSIRWILIVTTLCAVLALVVARADRGSDAAMAIVIAVATAATALSLFGILFLVCLGLSRVTRLARPAPPGRSPFATDSLPPQVITPHSDDAV